jgi:hypothetical protein
VDQLNFIEKVAGKIVSLGLTTPALVGLEAHKPLAFLTSQLLLVAQPTLNLFFSPDITTRMVELLASPVQLDQLITHLDQQAHEKSNWPDAVVGPTSLKKENSL